MLKLNNKAYRDKVQGCWMGKNIGGTLGGPFEWQSSMNNATFYVQETSGKPLPNDDLDLQLLWIMAAEERGVPFLNERVLAEYWAYENIGPWNEYGVSKANIASGLMPPLSGSCNNERWKWSNGAWIRSEIWACLFPGMPDIACRYAYYDACIDHCDEGIYAEMFTASMESIAFLVNDIREIVEIGIARLPKESRVATTARLACDCYDKKVPFADARQAIVEANKDLGWFQAPGNLGFVVLGLLYGEGDFSKSICLATNCGDDADCTAGTVGAIMGIVLGRNAIPEKWTAPIGDEIVTCCILENRNSHRTGDFPRSVTALTDRTIHQAKSYAMYDSHSTQFTDGDSEIPDGYIDSLKSSAFITNFMSIMSPYRLSFDMPFGRFCVRYENGPIIEPGKPVTLYFELLDTFYIEMPYTVKLALPEGWSAMPSDECRLVAKAGYNDRNRRAVPLLSLTFIPGDFSGSMYYLPIHIKLQSRDMPYTINLPLQKKGAVKYMAD